VSLPTWLFICCDSDSLLIWKCQLLVKTLLKIYLENCSPQLIPDGRNSDFGEEENNGSHATQFTLPEPADAFLETTFYSILTYQDRKKQIAKYGEPDSRWTTCPSLAPVVVATLHIAAIKNDKVAFRTQQMCMEAIAPLAAFLESADDENFTIKEAVPMVQSAIKLLGHAIQRHSAIRRKAIMQHLNPQLQTLMKDEDFKGAQPLLFGEHFGEKAKSQMEEAVALKEIVLLPKPKHLGFQKGHSQQHTGGHQGRKTKHYDPTNKSSKKELASQGKSWLEPLIVSTPRVSILDTIVNPIPTGDCSKAPPRGVDGSDEPDHHQSHAGWKFITRQMLRALRGLW